MPSDKLSENQVRWLTYLVWILITFLTVVTAYNVAEIKSLNSKLEQSQQAIHERISRNQEDMPNKYVLKERYLCDTTRIENSLRDINGKLDKLIGDNRR